MSCDGNAYEPDRISILVGGGHVACVRSAPVGADDRAAAAGDCGLAAGRYRSYITFA